MIKVKKCSKIYFKTVFLKNFSISLKISVDVEFVGDGDLMPISGGCATFGPTGIYPRRHKVEVDFYNLRVFLWLARDREAISAHFAART